MRVFALMTLLSCGVGDATYIAFFANLWHARTQPPKADITLLPEPLIHGRNFAMKPLMLLVWENFASHSCECSSSSFQLVVFIVSILIFVGLLSRKLSFWLKPASPPSSIAFAQAVTRMPAIFSTQGEDKKTKIPPLYGLHLHAQRDDDGKVKLEFSAVNTMKNQERLGELLKKSPVKPDSPDAAHWKLVVPPVTVQKGEPGAIVNVPGPKVQPSAEMPPFVRAVATRSLAGAARTVGDLADVIRKQGVFNLLCRTQLAEELTLGFGQSLGGGVQASAAGQQGATKRGPPNNGWLEGQERLAKKAKESAVFDLQSSSSSP